MRGMTVQARAEPACGRLRNGIRQPLVDAQDHGAPSAASNCFDEVREKSSMANGSNPRQSPLA